MKNIEKKILKLEDTIQINNSILTWKPFNDWQLSNKHYLLCFIGNLFQGIKSFRYYKCLTKDSYEKLLIATTNFYRTINKNDWLLVENHIEYRRGETIYNRIENSNFILIMTEGDHTSFDWLKGDNCHSLNTHKVGDKYVNLGLPSIPGQSGSLLRYTDN